ncbi:MAG: hypothetical protein KDD77_05550 [Caldilineaceae bacterium]|nr:hypothetical protein [Caldilineaceae bacterium]
MHTKPISNAAESILLADVLADAFDYAATHCATKNHAALVILNRLRESGFAVVVRNKQASK